MILRICRRQYADELSEILPNLLPRIGRTTLPYGPNALQRARHVPRLAVSLWRVEVHGSSGYYRQAIIPLAVDPAGKRLSTADAAFNHLREIEPAMSSPRDAAVRTRLVNSTLPEMLRQEVEHRGLLREDASLATRLIGWVEIG